LQANYSEAAMRRALFAAALLAVTAPALAAGKPADKHVAKPATRMSAGMTRSRWRLDEVHTVTFRTPVATVYVRQPSIADVTMIDARHAFVQGKAMAAPTSWR
jgi:hypothetical protein